MTTPLQKVFSAAEALEEASRLFVEGRSDATGLQEAMVHAEIRSYFVVPEPGEPPLPDPLVIQVEICPWKEADPVHTAHVSLRAALQMEIHFAQDDPGSAQNLAAISSALKALAVELDEMVRSATE